MINIHESTKNDLLKIFYKFFAFGFPIKLTVPKKFENPSKIKINKPI